MAPVVKGRNWWMLLLGVLLLTSPLFPAGVVSEEATAGITFLVLSGSDDVVEAEVLSHRINGSFKQSPALAEAFSAAEKGDVEEAESILQETNLTKYLDEIETESAPLEGVDVYFYYYKREEVDNEYTLVKHEITGCYPAEITDEEGRTSCVLPQEVYEDTCTEVFVRVGDEVYGLQQEGRTYKSTQDSIRVCDRDTSALAVMSDSIKNALTTEENIQNPLCFISMILAGLLLASMFFAGRSPISLLDITTPLLPKAKSISYSGIKMGTGFSRMAEQRKFLGDKINTASQETINRLLRHIRSKKGHSKHLIKKILDSEANPVLKMLALRALSAGKDKRYIDRILGMQGKSVEDKEYLETYGKVLADLENADDVEELDEDGGIHSSSWELARMNILLQMESKAFAEATGSVPKWFKSTVGKTLGRLPLLRTHFMGGTASMFYGGRHLFRMYSTPLRGLIRRTGDALTPKGKEKWSKRVQMAVDDAKAKGKKPSRFASWVALKDHERNVVSIYNNFAFGAEFYDRMVSECKKDVMHWLIGEAIRHYGGKTDLDRDEVLEIGFKNPEELLFAGMNMKGFKKFEKDLRKILADPNMHDLRKAKAIMRLMKENGISFDEEGVSNAITMLHKIDNEVPKSPSSADVIDVNNEDAVKSRKLQRLQEYLRDQFGVDRPVDFKREYINKGKFFFTVGRQTLSYGNTDLSFGTFLRSKYREALESPVTLRDRDGNLMKPLGISEIANYAFLRVVNERWGIFDPNERGLSRDLKIVMLNAQKWMQSLANPLQIDSSDAKAMISSLQAAGREEYGPVKGDWKMDMHAHWRVLGGDMGGAKSSVEEQAYGEVHNAFNIPMAVQRMIEKSGGKLTMEQAQEKYQREVVVPSYLFERLQHIIEEGRENTYFTSQSEFRRFNQIWASFRSHLAREKGKDERNITDKEIAEFIKNPLDMDEIAKSTWVRMREGQYAPFDSENVFRWGQAERPVNANFYIRRGGYWEEFAPEKFMKERPFADLLKKESNIKKMLFGETDYLLKQGEIRKVPQNVLKQYQNMMDELSLAEENKRAPRLSASDFNNFFSSLKKLAEKSPRKAEACAAMAGRLLSDNSFALGRMGIDASDLDLATVFGKKTGEKVRLELLLHKYGHSETAEERERAAKALKEWAGEGGPGEERHVKVALLFYQRAQSTENWEDFNGYREAIKFGTPATRSSEVYAGKVEDYEKVGGVRGWFKNMWNMGRKYWDPITNKANLGFEKFLLSTFGQQMKAEYEGSTLSNYFRESGSKFAMKLASGEFNSTRDGMRSEADPAMRAYRDLADTFNRYHALWDETITRDPRGSTSAIGSPFIYSAFFHHGPAMSYGPGAYQRWSSAGSQPWTTWQGFKANIRERMWGIQWAPQIFNWAIGTPFGLAYRTYLTSSWGFMSKYDRQYRQAPVYEGKPAQFREEATKQYEKQMDQYNARFEELMKTLQHGEKHLTTEQARAEAERQLRAIKPEIPAFDLQRDILHPYSQTQPRRAEARASMLNWFYSSFDPTSTNWKKLAAVAAASPLSPLAYIPSRFVQSRILGNGTPLLNRSDSNPYYVSPGNARSMLVKAFGGPMVKRHYGGTEMMTGVVRAHEDSWMYQAGVNTIWGNGNPGATYVDFSFNLRMDPRTANHLRYESRFRPFMDYDQYVRKQTHLGLFKRDVDPFSLMMDRNAELRHYKFPQNTLFRFLNPATYFGYQAKAQLGRVGRAVSRASSFFQERGATSATTRGGEIRHGAKAMFLRSGEAVGEFMKRKAVDTVFAKSFRYCPTCGTRMPEGGTCPACSKKVRCAYCGQVVSPNTNHTCTHGIQRNILKDNLAGDNYYMGKPHGYGTSGFMETTKARWARRWGREA